MWKNWFSFGRKEEKKQGTTEDLLKTGKENGTDQRSATGNLTSLKNHEINHDYLHAATASTSRRSRLDTVNKDRFPGSQPRSPFRSRISYIDNESFASGEVSPVMKLKDSGSVLSTLTTVSTVTPLMPKIKRAIELNDSLSGNIHVSSPLSQNRTAVPRSQSINYGPTHPTKSTPGRLPVVTLQRRQSLQLVTGPKVLSPSTVKVAPPDQSMLTGTSFRLSASVMGAQVSPVKSVVDTSTVVSALRERRKRNTVAANDDSVGDISQIAKRRRQGDAVANVTVPLLPEKLSDLTASQAGLGNSLSSLKQMEQIVSKRPVMAAMASVRRPLLNDDMQESQPAPKRDRPQHHNSRVLSSLSSSTRTDYAACAQAEKQMPVTAGLSVARQIRPYQSSGKRTLGAVQTSEVQNGTSATAAKRPTLSCETPVSVAKAAAQSSQTTASDVKDNASTCALTSTPVAQEKTTLTSTPKRKVLSMMASGRMHTDVFLTLGCQLTNPVIMASPADVDQDRKEEDSRRVRDMLAFLDYDEEGSIATPATLVSASGLRTTFATATTSTCAPVAVVTTATATTAFSSCFASTTTTTTATTTVTTPPATTASSLLELLSAPLTSVSTAMVSSSLKAPSLSAFPSDGSQTSLSTAVTVSLGISSMLGSSLPAGLGTGLNSSVAGLVHSSGASATDALTSSKPICSTGSSGSSSLLSTSAMAPGSAAATFVASSSAPVPHLTSMVASSAPEAAESMTASPPQYTFQPVFGTQTTSAPQSVSSQNNAEPKGGGFSFGRTAAADSIQNASVTPASSFLGEFSFGEVKSQTTTSTTTTCAAQSFSFGGANSKTSTAPPTQSFHFGSSNSQTSSAAPQPFSFGGSTIVQTTATAAPPSFSFGGASAQAASSQSFSFVGSGSSLTATPAAQLINPNSMSTAQPSSQNFSFASGGSGNSFQFGGTNITSATASTGATQPFSFGPKPMTAATNADTTAPSGGHFSFGQLTATANKKSSDVIFGAAAATKSATSPSTFSFGGASNNATSSGAAGFSFGLHSQSGGQQPNAVAATQLVSALGGSGESKQSTSMFASPQASSTAASSSGVFGGFGSGSVAQPAFGQSVGTTSATSFSFGAAAPTAGSGNSFSFGSVPATTTASSSFSFGSAVDSSTGPFSFGQPSARASSRFSFGAPTTTASSSRTVTFGQTATVTTTAGATNPFSFGQPMSSAAPANGSLPFGGAATTATASGFSFGGAATQASGTSGFSFGSSAGSSAAAPFSFGANTGNVFGQPSAAPFAIGAQAQQQQQTMGFGMQRSQTVPEFPTAQSSSTFGGFGSVSSSTGFNFGSSSANPSPAFGLSTQSSAPAFGSSQGLKFGISHSNNSTPVFGASSNNTPVFGASSNASNSSGGGFSFGASTTQTPQKNFNFASSGGGGGAFQFGSPAGGGGGSGSGFNFNSSLGAGSSTPGTMFTPGAGSAAPKSRVMARPSSSRRSRAGRR